MTNAYTLKLKDIVGDDPSVRRVLDQGFVKLIDFMPHDYQFGEQIEGATPGDLAIVAAARVSYGTVTKGVEADRKLVNYLVKHGHTSPLEMVEFKFLIKAPVIMWWQHVRHRIQEMNFQCLAGSSVITFDRTGGGTGPRLKKTIAELYDLWANGERAVRSNGNGQTYHRDMKTRIRKMNLRVLNEETNTFEVGHIHEVYSSGEKPVYRLTYEDGRTLDCTLEHRLLTAHGWRTVQDAFAVEVSEDRTVQSASLGIQTVCNGQVVADGLYRNKQWLEERLAQGLYVTEIAALAGCSIEAVKKWVYAYGLKLNKRDARFKPGMEPWNKDNGGYQLNIKDRTAWVERIKQRTKYGKESHLWRGGVTSERALNAVWTRSVAPLIHERFGYRCQICSTHRRLHTHHIVPYWADPALGYDMDNLVTLCQTCHYQLHAENCEKEFAASLNKNNWPEVPASTPPVCRKLKGHLLAVVKIEYLGVQPTYDIAVEGPWHNFVANSVVVHNSGRYTPYPEDEYYLPEKLRAQDTVNKQSSVLTDFLTDEEERGLLAELKVHYEAGFALYQKMLEKGVAKEMARLALPGWALYHSAYVKMNAHALMNYLSKRLEPGAQYEIRVYAEAMEHSFAEKLPWVYAAWQQSQRSMP